MKRFTHVIMVLFVLLMGVTLFADEPEGKVSTDTAPTFIYDADSIQDLAIEPTEFTVVATSVGEIVAQPSIFEVDNLTIASVPVLEDREQIPGQGESHSLDYGNMLIPRNRSLYLGSIIHRTMRYRG